MPFLDLRHLEASLLRTAKLNNTYQGYVTMNIN